MKAAHTCARRFAWSGGLNGRHLCLAGRIAQPEVPPDGEPPLLGVPGRAELVSTSNIPQPQNNSKLCGVLLDKWETFHIEIASDPILLLKLELVSIL
ncbi:MAG: hypothetical protein A2758_03040 [Candidatus Zambryskibacteria bacterium RIFCSPHIGHO2_01_FULL_49_18]|uniref:Uncharacterized protein n=2 Tax=Candidatus Zambryskiibacteriota TaxID=1817925 RepID=A0A1G2T294_9BACT|nr:MAG: hypothetical protein A2758_03040 [Candidatus Zambryskibacteria bacterium RIFCSPHIGHO2_01_FULL_49_18]OHB05046.1 MAG: hypothetical protein A3A26_00535 [Candidatus Zambryskibacteria bacterium RIFCSPLOWO2_01_FULL_47_14]